MIRKFLIVLMLVSTSLFAQFQGGTFNNILNLGDHETLELVPGKKMSKEEKAADNLVGDLFGKVGLDTKTNENPLLRLTSFNSTPGQLWKITMVTEGEFVIFNDQYKQALTVEGGSKEVNAKVIPENYQKDAQHQIFYVQRDTVKYRYGCYLISKHSGLVLEYNKESKELFQNKMSEGNSYQVWALSLRKKMRNAATGQVIMPEKKNIFFPGAIIGTTSDVKSMYANWNFINHPTASGIYYVMNSFSKQFLTVPKNEEGNVLTGGGIKQMPYNPNGQLLFHFKSVEGSPNTFIFYIYPGEAGALISEENMLKTVPADPTQKNQHWIMEEGTFSLF
ncbi:MAG: RICIN domain-containing protein [Melioribacteraceae bacterium]|nr:RICIN domain-containing protein [Melioribacteraceae bacterium]MCF8354512.1 RICIN domain-containing protein [Melioribacteraceae bacterium]MCF8394281.1 RICIN domain-containing protein [Melioribacteraceae bacterium]MCF8418181.1 RICIN domain-containing protein [Melioribacteraceae bacterium]